MVKHRILDYVVVFGVIFAIVLVMATYMFFVVDYLKSVRKGDGCWQLVEWRSEMGFQYISCDNSVIDGCLCCYINTCERR